MMTMGEDMPALRVFARKSSSGGAGLCDLFQLAVANLLLSPAVSRLYSISSSSPLLFCSSYVSASSSCASRNPSCPAHRPGDTR